MGWTFPYHTYNRKTLIQERITTFKSEKFVVEVVRHCVRGNNLWKLMQVTRQDGSVERFIALDLMSKAGGETWGYKDLEDSCGPCYYNCPLSYVEACTATSSEYATKWRNNVREYWAERRKK